MAGTWYDEFAIVYDACAQIGLADPRRVDELAIWEVASILGVNRAPVEEPLIWPEDAPISSAAALSALASSEGRDRPRASDPPPTREQWNRAVALAQSAKRRSG